MSCSRKALKKVSGDRAAFLDRACDGKGNMRRRSVRVYTDHRSSQSADSHLRRPGDRVGCGLPGFTGMSPASSDGIGGEYREIRRKTVNSCQHENENDVLEIRSTHRRAPETRGQRELCQVVSCLTTYLRPGIRTRISGCENFTSAECQLPVRIRADDEAGTESSHRT
jgi:hypothetical protein